MPARPEKNAIPVVSAAAALPLHAMITMHAPTIHAVPQADVFTQMTARTLAAI